MGRPTSFNPGRLTDVEKTMAPSTLDLLFLTFNCAKNLINGGVFASHLYGALSQNATTGLPDLVAFSLQEVAPLSYAFIGSYFLNPYYTRYEEALNLASARLLATSSAEPSGGSEYGPVARPYTLVRAKNVGMTAILLFARDPAAVHGIEEAECGFGAADMGNKGAVGLRVTWGQPSGRATTEVTLVATHLAAMEWNLKKRNANWRSIMSGLTFANPRAALPGLFPDDAAAPTPDRSGAGTGDIKLATDSSDSSEADEEDDTASDPLLPHAHSTLTTEQREALRDMSIFKPTSHLFVAGDLNYRIDTTTPSPLAPFPSFDTASDDHYSNFLPRDQLTRERLAGRTFHGMTEALVTFGPTYKYNVLASADGAANEAAIRRGAAPNGVPEVPWRFASHRWPGWCDRVLYLDLPEWVSSKKSGGDGEKKKAIEVRAYDSLPVVRTSDHRPVFLRVAVPVISAEEMAPPAKVLEENGVAVAGKKGVGPTDPRVAPPVAVDVHAWERRAAARRREIVVGWTAFFWSTREGAVVMATLLALVVGMWWLYNVW